MRSNFLKLQTSNLSRKTLYLLTIFILTIASLSFLLLTNSPGSGIVSAQQNDKETAANKTAGRLPADVLGIALDLRSAADLTVFGNAGLVNKNSRIKGEAVDGLRDAETGKRVKNDLARAFSTINQLPCRELDSKFAGAAFEPGVYCASSARLAKEIVLDGKNEENGIFIFKIKGSLSAESDLQMSLVNNAEAQNVFFITDDTATIEAGTVFRGNILAKNSIAVGAKATVVGKTLSLDGAVTADESNLGGGMGNLQICKFQQGTGLENRIFRFRVGSNMVEIQTGQCSDSIELPVGLVVIEELASGPLLPSGTWSGGFKLLDINSPTPGSLGAINLALRTANVFISEGNAGNQTVVNFTNAFTVNAYVEICKHAVAPTSQNTSPPSTIPINDQDISGIFNFTIDAIPNTTFPVAVGQCSGPIQVDVSTSPGPSPQTATIRVTEIAKAGYTLESATTIPADRFQSLTLDGGISNPNETGGYPNPRGGFVTATVVEGDTSNQTTVNFFNRSNPAKIKICKIAGPGIPEGTRFRFEVRGLAPSGPGNVTLPGMNVARIIDIPAGAAAQGGSCNFVEGTFIVGTNVLVTEIGSIDTIPGSNLAAAQEASKISSRAESNLINKAGKFSIFDVVKSNAPATRSQSFAKGVLPGTLESVKNQSLLSPVSASPEALTPFITETGLISLSLDSVGTNSASGIVEVQKPAGATVRRAFLMAATIPNGTTLSNTDITINGAPVTFTSTVQNTLVSPPQSGVVNNYLGDVTALVKSTIDAAPAGRVNFNIAENPAKTLSIDGVVLAVIFDDPTQTVSNTVALLFGALSPNGDNFAIGLANPINTSAAGFALNMSLGISFGYQGIDQFSRVDVSTNTRTAARLTSSAGGQDDGAAENGALITVGGLDDSNTNPANPNATPNGDPRIDDEFYSLIPFVNNGDTTINVTTNNPSNNDNIFFAAFFVGNNTAVIGEGITLTPPSATNPIGTQHTVTAAVQNAGGDPVTNRQVRFNVLTGPNAGASGSVNTNGNGRADFTYTSNGTVGTDTIRACFTNLANQEICSNVVSKTWIIPNEDIVLTPTTATNPVGTSHTVTASVQSTGGQPVANRQVRFRILTGPNADLTGSINTTPDGRAAFTYTSNGATGTDTIRACFTNLANQEICSNTVEKIWELTTFPVPPVSRITSTCGFAPDGTTVQGIYVNPNPNRDSKQSVIPVRQGFCEVTYANFLLRPTLLRICKIAGPGGIAIGTPFTFDIAIDDEGGLFPGLSVPPLTVQAGPASQGGFCAFAQGPYTPTNTNPGIGTFRSGSRVTVTERAVTGTTVAAITSSTGPTEVIDLPNRRAVLTLDAAGSFNELTFTNQGSGADLPKTLFDFDGDRTADISIFRDGTWIWTGSANGQTLMIDFGLETDKIVPADYDGDGKTDPAVYREGFWYIIQSSNGQFRAEQFGAPDDIPQGGDYDGDGKADLAVYRPSTGIWYILQSTAGFTGVLFGAPNDKPVLGDFDGDGKADIAVYRPSEGTWYILQSLEGFTAVQFGTAADKLVPADYDGDGSTDVAVYRGGFWYILQSTAGFAAVQFGIASDIPVPADYDGDGRADIAVFRDGTWHILRSSLPPATQYISAQLGNADVVPVPSAYVR